MSESVSRSLTPTLSVLYDRQDRGGRLQYAPVERTRSLQGPTMLFFHKHVLEVILASPSTVFSGEVTPPGEWRVLSGRKPQAGSQTETPSLLSIVSAFRGEIADWAVGAHEGAMGEIKEEARVNGVNLNGNYSLLESDYLAAQKEMSLLPAIRPSVLRELSRRLNGHQVNLTDRYNISCSGILSLAYMPPLITVEYDSTHSSYPQSSIHSLDSA